MRHGYHNLTNYRMLHIAKDSPFFEKSMLGRKIQSLFLEVPSDWACQFDSTWRYLFPARRTCLIRGWKIHLSSCLTEAQLLLDVVGGFFSQEESCFQAFGIVWELSETER